VVTDCLIAGNRTAGFGGGISNRRAPGTGNVTLIRSAVTTNVAVRQGGGVYVAGDGDGAGSLLKVNNSTIRLNQAGTGGGIRAEIAILANCNVNRNAVAVEGAASSPAPWR